VSKLTVQGVVHEILKADLNLSADDVIQKAKARGLRASDAAIRSSAHNVKSRLKRARAKASPADARETAPPETPEAAAPAAAVATAPVAAAPAPAGPSMPPTDLAGGRATLAAVNRVVQACGGVDVFLLHLDLLAGLKNG
jgi:hypothetical protein